MLTFVFVALAAGASVGLLAGMLGIGGGLILVPVLFEMMLHLGAGTDTAMRSAIATSLACVIATGLRSALSHHRRGVLERRVVMKWMPTMLIGALCGAEVATRIDAGALISAFALMTLLLAINMAYGSTQGVSKAPPRWPLVSHFAGAVVGLIAALLGLGVAGLGVPLMTFFGASVRAAVAAAALIGALVAISPVLRFVLAGHGVADLPRASLGYVNLLGFALIVPIAMIATPIGAAWSHRVSQTSLKRVFAVFLCLNAVRMLFF